MANEITIDVVARLDKIEKQLSGLEKTAKKQGEDIGESLGGGISIGLGKIAAIATTILGAFSFKKAIDEAIHAEKSIKILNASLANAGNFTEEASKNFENFAKSLQAVTNFSDDLIISNASVLASIGRLSGEGLERATKAALDFASSGRIGVEGAFDAIAKAANGSFGAFSRYGIKVDENLSQSQKFEQVLKQLESRFGGLSEVAGASFGGILERINNQFSDLFETVGKFITQSPVIVALLKAFSESLLEANKSLEKVGQKDVVGEFTNKLINFSSVVINAIATIELFKNIIVAAFAFAKQAVQGLIVLLTDLPARLGIIVGEVIKFGSVAGDIMSALGLESGAQLKATLEKTGQSIIDVSANVKTTAMENLEQFTLEARAALDGVFSFESTLAIDNFLAKIKEVAANAPAIGSAIKNGISTPFEDASKAAKRAADSINKSFQQGIVNTISAAAQAVGASLVKGGKAFDNFKNLVLNIIGDMAIQIGSTLIGIGIGIDAIKLSLGTLTGGFAIAAGLALVAVGGLLKSLSSGDSGSLGVGGGVGTPAGGPSVGGGEFGAIAPDLVQRERGTVVNVNVEGNILDRRETGLEIANIIQEQFDVNGNVIAQGNFA